MSYNFRVIMYNKKSIYLLKQLIWEWKISIFINFKYG